MKAKLLNRKLLAVVFGVVLFVGMSMTTYGQQSQHKKKKNMWQAQQQMNVAQHEQQLNTTQHEQRMTEYHQHLNRRQQLHQQSVAQLQQAKRMAQYRYQLRYSMQMLQQQRRYANAHNHNYQNDPFFRTAFDRRYHRGGTYYHTNSYGIAHLHQAIQYGYAEGFQAGMSDRLDHWRSDYERCAAYQDAIYGYNGYYVKQDEYSYYFREGFRRGYEDGYSRRYRYGRHTNGRYSILGSVLAAIITFEMLR